MQASDMEEENNAVPAAMLEQQTASAALVPKRKVLEPKIPEAKRRKSEQAASEQEQGMPEQVVESLARTSRTLERIVEGLPHITAHLRVLASTVKLNGDSKDDDSGAGMLAQDNRVKERIAECELLIAEKDRRIKAFQEACSDHIASCTTHSFFLERTISDLRTERWLIAALEDVKVTVIERNLQLEALVLALRDEKQN